MMLLTSCYAIAYIVEAITIWKYLSNFFKSKYRRFTEISLFVLAYVLLFIVSRFDSMPANTIFFLVINYLLCYGLFWVNLKTACFHTLILTSIMGITEVVVLNILASIFGNVNAYTTNLVAMVIFLVTSKMMFYLFVQVIIFSFGRRKELPSENNIVISLLIIILMLSVGLMLCLYSIFFVGNLTDYQGYVIILCAMLILLINIIMFILYHFSLKVNEEYTLMQLQVQKESTDAQYYKMLSERNENQNILIHDLKNHLRAILILNAEGKKEEIKRYIERLEPSDGLKKTVELCDNTVLNVILERCRQLCDEKKIRFDVDIRAGCMSDMHLEDISSLFGNLLDNAVEAAEICNEADAFIELSVKFDTGERNIVIDMINTCSEVPETDNHGRYMTRKKDVSYHGIGLKSIENVVKKYKGKAVYYYKQEDHTFHSVIALNRIKHKENFEKAGDQL